MLRAEDPAQLSSLITLSTQEQFYVHLDDARSGLVYEDVSREEFLALLVEAEGLFIRTFLLPRNRPMKHVRALFRIPGAETFMQLPAELNQQLQTQEGALPPEPNTEYK